MAGLEAEDRCLVDLEIADPPMFILDLPVYAAEPVGRQIPPIAECPARERNSLAREVSTPSSSNPTGVTMATLLNAAALCPNCHRECHHGENAAKLRVELKTKAVVKRPKPLETSN
jgi:hypothetical protein